MVHIQIARDFCLRIHALCLYNFIETILDFLFKFNKVDLLHMDVFLYNVHIKLKAWFPSLDLLI